jgi:hypothetical protein
MRRSRAKEVCVLQHVIDGAIAEVMIDLRARWTSVGNYQIGKCQVMPAHEPGRVFEVSAMHGTTPV